MQIRQGDGLLPVYGHVLGLDLVCLRVSRDGGDHLGLTLDVHVPHDERVPLLVLVGHGRDEVVAPREDGHLEDAVVARVEGPLAEHFRIGGLPVTGDGVGANEKALGFEAAHAVDRVLRCRREHRERDVSASEQPFPERGILGELVVELADLVMCERDGLRDNSRTDPAEIDYVDDVEETEDVEEDFVR